MLIILQKPSYHLIITHYTNLIMKNTTISPVTYNKYKWRVLLSKHPPSFIKDRNFNPRFILPKSPNSVKRSKICSD